MRFMYAKIKASIQFLILRLRGARRGCWGG